VPELKQQITDSLREGLSPTEWRRAAASLAAYGAVKPDEALKTTQAVAKRGLFTTEDPASGAAFVWGLPRAIEAEPEAAAKMLDVVLSAAPPEIAESIAELAWEHGPSKVVDRAMRLAHEVLESEATKPGARGAGQDDGAAALMHEIGRDLEGAPRDDRSLRALAFEALDAFVAEGAAAAHAKADGFLLAAEGAIDAVEAVAGEEGTDGRAGSIARRTSMAVVRDLDASLLERHTVPDLLKLGKSAERIAASEDALDAIRERFAAWIVTCESPDATRDAADGKPRHVTLRLRRLRSLLHLLDGDLGEGVEAIGRSPSPRSAPDGEGADVQRAKRLRALWLRTVKALLQHFDTPPPAALKRTLLAALARALDALVRLGACDVADALLVLAQRIETTTDFETLAEASMDPDLRHVLGRYARFLRETDANKPIAKIESDPQDSVFPPSIAPGPGPVAEGRLRAFEELANELAPEASARSEALRTVLMRLHQALSAMSKVGSLRGLSTGGGSEPDLVEAVETWVSAIVQMSAGARARLEPEVRDAVAAPPPRLLSAAVTRVLSAVDDELTDETLSPAIDELVADLPHGVARLIASMLWGLSELPVDRPSYVELQVQVAEQLPAWLPARRTIGGFYVVRSLGVGGTASVFVVNRVEDRHDPEAERFALKVPDYNATAARSVSQDEFLKLFREEASALIALPNHANLARFVTFDLAARPLPILVMELVEGMTVERVIDARALDVKKTLKALDDVLAGLEAMHAAGLGHLDLKPSNVILRKGEQAVLVDFGLAGRKIRTGCGTGPYGAPEVWGVAPDGVTPTPPAADIYAFGCLAFEMLTGSRLFDAPNEVAQISMHVAHDGRPAPVQALLANPETRAIGELLASTLRRDPRARVTADALRAGLRTITEAVGDAKWPVALAKTG
jgi:hypothetical protein